MSYSAFGVYSHSKLAKPQKSFRFVVAAVLSCNVLFVCSLMNIPLSSLLCLAVDAVLSYWGLLSFLSLLILLVRPQCLLCLAVAAVLSYWVGLWPFGEKERKEETTDDTFGQKSNRGT